MSTKYCSKCRSTKTTSQFNKNRSKKDGLSSLCRECNIANHRRYRGNKKFKANNYSYVRRHKLLAQYGITPEDFDQMVKKQKGVCAICREPCSLGTRLAVDHDHVTGKVRGLLCRSCNYGLGVFRDNPERLRAAAKYLARAHI